MRRRQRNTIFMVCMAVLLISTSIVPAFSIYFKDKMNEFFESKVDSFIEKKFNETESHGIPWSFYDVMNPDRGYDKERMMEYEDYRDVLYKRYPEYYHEDILDHSYFNYDWEYESFKEQEQYYQQLLEKKSYNNYNISNQPYEKPDFENGTTWYVDDVLGEGFNNPPEDFTKIQDAIDSIDVKNGDTIYVYAGIYYENIYINKSIILRGEDRNTTIIDGGGINNTVIVNVDWAGVFRFTIQNGFFCIWIFNSSDNTLKDNSIKYDKAGGIVLWDSVRNIIKDTIFQSNGINIRGDNIEHWNSHIIEDNFVNGKPIQYYKNKENEIVPLDTSQVILANCTNFFIENLEMSNIDTGIQVGFSENNTFKSNNISNNKNYGIVLISSCNNIIKENNMDGIELYFSSNNTISENIIKENNMDGIKLHYSSNNTISENNIKENNDIGINIGQSYNNYINNNRIIESSNGILLIFSDFNFIFNNEAINSSEINIFIYRSDNNKIFSNNCILSKVSISLQFSYYNDIKNNFCEKNFKGIILDLSDKNNITKNVLSKNYCGIELRHSCKNLIEKCNISHNHYFGLYSFGSRFNKIIRCDFIENNDRFKISHFEGEPGDKHFFFRNYWSGRPIQSPIPYLIHIDAKSLRSLFPLNPLTFNWDWFPKATPYDYDYDLDWSNT